MPGNRLRLLYLATQPPRDTTSGALLMCRHLALLEGKFAVHIASLAPGEAGDRNYSQLRSRPIFARLLRTRARRYAEGLDSWFGWSVPFRQVRVLMRMIRPDLVVTVAEGPAMHAARRAARWAGVPLVAVFHDWSTIWIDMPNKMRPFANRQFRRLFFESAAALCVSEELRASLAGAAGGGRVLHPIPNPDFLPPPPPGPAAPFHAVFAGVFSNFHSADVQRLGEALVARGRGALVRFLGPRPLVPSSTFEFIENHGLYFGYHKGIGLADRLHQAGALLVICPFGPHLTDFARYSFPSKLTEYCRYDRPMVIWGPEYAAGVRWARTTAAALIVTDPDPASLIAALDRLSRDPSGGRHLASASRRLAETDFNPQTLQSLFESALYAALGRDPAGTTVAAPAPLTHHG